MKSVNPFSGEVVAEYREHTWEEVDGRLVAAHRAFLDWRRVSFSDRAAVLRAAAQRLEARRTNSLD
jgi:succinate-semialdehyde dehydrogenase/glutarate-semialdehyde dehydrogenase